MNYKPIIIVAGEPNSIFLELFFKSLRRNNFKNPLILIASKKLLELQMKKLKFKRKIKVLQKNKLEKIKLDNHCINLINVDYKPKKAFEKISSKSNSYISNCFKEALIILKKYKIKKFINGPINKKTFLNKNYLGITEYISKKFNINNFAMLIYNKNLSVCPLTTHLPLKSVPKKINKEIIINKIKLINNFYKKNFDFYPKIAVLGLNPHCESNNNFNEDEKIIKPTVNYLNKLKYKVTGPFPADTIFLKQNRKKFDVILGMYHDQVLTPIKTLFEYDAINNFRITFIRISPDLTKRKC